MTEWDRVARDVRAAVEAALAALGFELDGELRGVLREAGRPETGNGFAAPVGAGLPEGWRRQQEERNRLAARVAELEAALFAARRRAGSSGG